MADDPFLTPEDEQRVVEAIRLAEKATTGEIRVHIEGRCRRQPLEQAKEVFARLGMHRTQLRNGILLYVAHKDRKAAIFGDQGIAEKVGDGFWESEFSTLREHFTRGDYAGGIEQVVGDMGAKLREFFPGDGLDATENPDELSNQVSYGEDGP